MDDPNLTELRALADQLRATIAEMDERIEARARQLVEEWANSGDATALLGEARQRIEQAGEAMRQEMITHVRARPDLYPEPDASRACELLAGMPAWMWTNSAASLFSDIMERDRKQAEGERRG